MNCVVYMDLRPFQCTVFRWIKAFKAGKFFVEDDTRPGRPKTSYQGLHRCCKDCGRTGCAIVQDIAS